MARTRKKVEGIKIILPVDETIQQRDQAEEAIDVVNEEIVEMLNETVIITHELKKVTNISKSNYLSNQEEVLPVKKRVKTIILKDKLTPDHCQNHGLARCDDPMDTCPNPCGACLESSMTAKRMGTRYEHETVLDVEKYNRIAV
jgi:hypothetical protein